MSSYNPYNPYAAKPFQVMSGNSSDEPPSDEQLEEFQKMSLNFIRNVKRIHGPDTAIGVINGLSETLGKQWSSRIIFDMLGNMEEPDTVRITFPVCSRDVALISLIKGFRAFTNSGLREAKDAIESLRDQVLQWELNLVKTQNLPSGLAITTQHYKNAPHFVVQTSEDIYQRNDQLKYWREAGGLFV